MPWRTNPFVVMHHTSGWSRDWMPCFSRSYMSRVLCAANSSIRAKWTLKPSMLFGLPESRSIRPKLKGNSILPTSFVLGLFVFFHSSGFSLIML